MIPACRLSKLHKGSSFVISHYSGPFSDMYRLLSQKISNSNHANNFDFFRNYFDAYSVTPA